MAVERFFGTIGFIINSLMPIVVAVSLFMRSLCPVTITMGMFARIFKISTASSLPVSWGILYSEKGQAMILPPKAAAHLQSPEERC